MKAKEFIRIENLINFIGKENSPKRATILDAIGINGYNNPIFKDSSFESKQNFLNDWLKYNNYESVNQQLLLKYGIDNKKVASFFNKPFVSGYSMGEIERIKIIASFEEIPIELFITVRDTTKQYTGKHGGLYNKDVRYGLKVLTITVKNGRAKYELSIKDKK